MRVAILEDDVDQSSLLSAWLLEQGHSCKVFDNGQVFVREYSKDSYDILIFDWMVPGMTGLEVLRHLRSRLDPIVPVIFITQRDKEQDIVHALESGADDYMSKPINQAEALARVNAIARRLGFGNNSAASYHFDTYKINTKTREVLVDDVAVEMTQKEYELTLFLFKNAGRVVSRGHLLEMVWGQNGSLNTRTVDTHVSRLRSKLKFGVGNDWKLTSVYQHGYRLEKLS